MIVLLKAHPAIRTMIGGDPTPAQAASGRYPKERMAWQGLTIAIEHPEGTVREGVDETGKAWRTVFRFAYGEILGTTGLDGDPVDVFIGSYPDAPEVYIVQQMRRKRWDEPDEQKCMINFGSIDEAKAAYLGHYDDPRFFGGITAMPVAEFVAKVRATRKEPKMIKSQQPAVLFFKAHVSSYTKKDGTFVAAHEDRRGAAKAPAPHSLGPAWRQDSPDIAAQIAKIMDDDDDYLDFGLRVVPAGHEVETGAVLPHSKRWDDGVDTGEELAGTSTIGIASKDKIAGAMRLLSRGGYSGAQVVLVGGEGKGSGEDAGESLIKDAKVFAAWSL